MNATDIYNQAYTRRQFFRKTSTGLGVAAAASLIGLDNVKAKITNTLPNFTPKAKRAIYISLIGAPSQFETFDYKPELDKRYKEDLKDYLAKQGERLTGMTSSQAAFPLAPARVKFKQYGSSGTYISDYLPWHGKMADDICVIRSMHTDAINHEPANQLICTGSMVNGKASLGSWLSYGLGSMNSDLPSFVVLHANHVSSGDVQAISNRLWSSAFLPGKHTGVSLRSLGDPVLFLKDNPGVSREMRRKMLDGLSKLNSASYNAIGDPEIQNRIQQYEMAYRMQSSVPELADLSGEAEHTYTLYGASSKTRGSFANSTLMARRLLERGVRFVQIFHRGWDQHRNLPRDIADQCTDIDQGCYGLIQDLKMRGMLEDTLVVVGGEFGRTVYSQGELSDTNYGRDHHPRCFSMWMAGGGIKGGTVYGATDELSYNITENPVHIRDLHATILHALGIDHSLLTYKFQGLDQKLTGVEPAKVISNLFV